LDLSYEQASLHVDDTVKARLTARYAGSTASGMVLIQAAIPPGFEPANDDLEKLVARRQWRSSRTTASSSPSKSTAWARCRSAALQDICLPPMIVAVDRKRRAR